MMGRKKRILIIVLSIILVLILLIGGVLIYLNSATDVFKSDVELFYKYFYQNASIVNVCDSNLLDRYYQKIDNNKYTESGEFTIKTGLEDGSQSDTNDFDTLINNLKLTYDLKSNLPDKKQSADIKLLYNNEQDLFELNVLRNDNKYGVKSDEVVYKYLAVENQNLQDIYTKMGLENVDSMQNQISRINYNIYKNMNIEDKNKILSTYQNVLNSEISENHYSVLKNTSVDNDNYNMYMLSITEEELSSLKIKLLETLMNDDLTLNYLVQLLQLDASYSSKIKQNIQEKIDELKREQTDPNKTIDIKVYEKNMKLVSTVIETDEYYYTINNDITESGQVVTITKRSKDGNNISSTLKLERKTSDTENSLAIENTEVTGQTTTGKTIFNITLNGNIELDNLELSSNMQNTDGDKFNEISYKSKKEFNTDVEIEDLNADNSVTINTMTIEELNTLVQSIIDRINYLYNEKVQSVGFSVNDVNYQASLKWSRIVDAFDENEFRAQVQRALNLAKDDMQNKEEYVTMVQEANGDQNRIKQIKGIATVERLKETGLDASLNMEDNSISIKTNNETAYLYEIDYDNFKISKID